VLEERPQHATLLDSNDTAVNKATNNITNNLAFHYHNFLYWHLSVVSTDLDYCQNFTRLTKPPPPEPTAPVRTDNPKIYLWATVTRLERCTKKTSYFLIIRVLLLQNRKN